MYIHIHIHIELQIIYIMYVCIDASLCTRTLYMCIFIIFMHDAGQVGTECKRNPAVYYINNVCDSILNQHLKITRTWLAPTRAPFNL